MWIIKFKFIFIQKFLFDLIFSHKCGSYLFLFSTFHFIDKRNRQREKKKEETSRKWDALGRSLIIFTLCLTYIIHIFNSTWILVYTFHKWHFRIFCFHVMFLLKLKNKKFPNQLFEYWVEKNEATAADEIKMWHAEKIQSSLHFCQKQRFIKICWLLSFFFSRMLCASRHLISIKFEVRGQWR